MERIIEFLKLEPFQNYSQERIGPDILVVHSGILETCLVLSSVFNHPEDLQPYLAKAERQACSIILLYHSEEQESLGAWVERYWQISDCLQLPTNRYQFQLLLKNTFERQILHFHIREEDAVAERYHLELKEFTEIARVLSSERDTEKLLGMILDASIYITKADAGSLYILESNHGAGAKEGFKKKWLRFTKSKNLSMPQTFKEMVLPLDTRSIAGYVAVTGTSLIIPDVYKIPRDAAYSFNPGFDEKSGYRAKSMLTVPMINRRNEVLGVIQLINRKRHPQEILKAPSDFEKKVIPFDGNSEANALSLAGQASVYLESAILYKEIQDLFEGFVLAAIVAIESRDPTTFGHSRRVCRLCLALADLITQSDAAPFENVFFNDDDLLTLKYAALLHDFGKVGVREKVLVKSHKLYEEQKQLIEQRFNFIKKSLEAECLKQGIALHRHRTSAEAQSVFTELEKQLALHFAEIDRFRNLVLTLNQPALFQTSVADEVTRLNKLIYRDLDGKIQPYITPEEMRRLLIQKGSLTEDERVEIESHVEHTYRFLKKIPWSRSLRKVPDIAYAHHEKLDGSGYPRRLKENEIPLPSQIMTIADIYDALTASDRPYKKAVTEEKALQILGWEAKENKINLDLLNLFIQHRVYEVIRDDRV